MRSTSTLLVANFALFATLVTAQAPQGFTYQGVVRDAFGNAEADQAVGVQFQLHQGNAAGTVVFSETHGTTTNDHGLFNLQVGSGTPAIGTIGAIDWRSGPYFLEVSLDLTSSGSYASMGAQQLLSVPYALHAGSSSNVPDGTEPGQIMHWTGTAWVADSGLYVHQKRFGIGITTPESPLGIAADTTDGSAIRIYQASSNTGPGPFNPLAWNIIVNPSNSDVAGFSIDDATSGVATSRLFIADSSGNVGIGTTEPEAPLSVKSRDYLYEKFQNGDIPDEQDFMISSGGNTGLSIDQDTTGGSVSRLFIQAGTGHVGIGDPEPEAPLSIQTRETLKTYFETGDVPTQDQFGISTDSAGFDIGQGAANALQSRFFLRASTGNVGIGTTQPMEKLHIEGSTSAGVTGLRLLNTATAANSGFTLGHRSHASSERDGAFSLIEQGAIGELERMTVLSNGNVGINEVLPFATLHVTRPVSDPLSLIGLMENTGIVVVGPITDNVVFDHRGLQARHGTFVPGGTSLSLSISELNLQRLGGDILIHGDDAVLSNQVTVTSDGKIGVGKTAVEKVDINGAITIGNTSTAMPAEGTIRFDGSNFEGFAAGDWAIFNGNVWEKVDNTDHIFYNAGSAPRVGIGTPTPTATLDVRDSVGSPEGSTAAFVNNVSSMANLLDDHYLLGLRVATTGSGGGAGGSRKSIGLYVSNVSGQSSANRNLAAVLNGNTVIGDLVPNANVVGANGTNVLAIQDGAAPTTIPGSTANGGIQIFSDEIPGSGSTFHVMNGDGTVIKLHRSPDLTAANTSSVGAGVDPATAALIENMRTRINELETILKNMGVLAP